MEDKFSPLIDARNSDLWEELKDACQLKLEESSKPGYLTSFRDNTIIIQVDMGDLNPACLTHELLHILLKKKKVMIAQDLKEGLEKSAELKDLFSDSLEEHLGNCLEHVKMLPLYLNRGFKNRDFVKDYHEKLMTKEELLELQSLYKQNTKFSQKAFDHYLGKFYSMKSTNNKRYNYDEFFQGLNNIDASLYTVLNRFWENWDTYDIVEPPEKYRKMLDEFIEDLVKWREDKVFIK